MTGRPRGLTADACADWAALARPTEVLAPFDPRAIGELPEPTRRWVRHAIAPAALLLTSVELRMHGEIRLGSWRPFTAVQRLAPAGGFVWAATARLFDLPVMGFDRQGFPSAILDTATESESRLPDVKSCQPLAGRSGALLSQLEE